MAESEETAWRPVGAYILIRLLLGLALLLLASLTVQGDPGAVDVLGGRFQLAAGLFLVMGVSAALLPRFGQRRWFPWSQLVVDTVFASALISFTGGPGSPFFPLYFLNIVASAWLLDPRGPILVAAVDALAFLALLGWRGMPWLRELAEGDPFRLYLQVTLQIFAFVLVGLLSGMLSANVRRARAALAVQVRQARQLQERYDLVLDGIDTGVLLVSGQGSILSANPSARRLLGDVDGRELVDVLDSVGRHWEQAYTQDGDLRTLQCSRMPLDSPEEPGGELVLVEDVTRLKEMEARVAREERLSAVGRLAAGLAHEIRNPLASLSGSVQLLKEGESSPLHDIVLREVRRLNELVEEFLDSSRPIRLDLSQADIGAIIGEVVAAFRNDARYRGRRVIRTRSEPGLPSARVDEGRMRQVLWNLLLNAAQATPDYGTIEVSATRSGQRILVRVSDDGVGISAEGLRKIFDPFFTTRSGGTGLGLANVERIVRAHGGQVEVSSEPGVGTTFVLHMPLGGPKEADPIAESGTETAAHLPAPGGTSTQENHAR